MREWLEASLLKLSKKSDTSAAIRYALGLWDALLRYCDDGTHRNRQQRRRTGTAHGCAREGRTICLPDQMQVESVQRRSIVWSGRPS